MCSVLISIALWLFPGQTLLHFENNVSEINGNEMSLLKVGLVYLKFIDFSLHKELSSNAGILKINLSITTAHKLINVDNQPEEKSRDR